MRTPREKTQRYGEQNQQFEEKWPQEAVIQAKQQQVKEIEETSVKNKLPGTQEELNKTKGSTKEEKPEQRKKSTNSEIWSETLIFIKGEENPKKKAMTK